MSSESASKEDSSRRSAILMFIFLVIWYHLGLPFPCPMASEGPDCHIVDIHPACFSAFNLVSSRKPRACGCRHDCFAGTQPPQRNEELGPRDFCSAHISLELHLGSGNSLLDSRACRNRTFVNQRHRVHPTPWGFRDVGGSPTFRRIDTGARRGSRLEGLPPSAPARTHERGRGQFLARLGLVDMAPPSSY